MLMIVNIVAQMMEKVGVAEDGMGLCLREEGVRWYVFSSSLVCLCVCLGRGLANVRVGSSSRCGRDERELVRRGRGIATNRPGIHYSVTPTYRYAPRVFPWYI
jgi:hypothetical protein